MSGHAVKLIDVVKQLVGEHRNLLEACRAHTDALIGGKVEEIEASVHKVEQVSGRIQELEAERAQWVTDWAKQIGLADESPTLTQLQPHMTIAEWDVLSRLAKELQQIVAQLAEVNEQNRGLLDQSLGYLAKTVQLVVAALEQDGYGPGGSRRQGGHLFNVQA